MTGAAADPAVALSRRIESVFEAIALGRMRGLPVMNAALRVEAVGFQRWQEDWIGVLLTPWFMNAMLLPGAEGAWAPVAVGTVREHRLPSGSYAFIRGHEPGLGDYESCSLFSPMFEFETQEAARATARAALNALLLSEAEDQDRAAQRAPERVMEARLQQPMSRRDLLRGAFLRGGRR